MNQVSTQQKGAVTELQVAAYIMGLGYNVSKPLSQDSKYDLVVDVGGRFIRVQVKTSRKDSEDSIAFSCRTTTTNVKNCKSVKYTSHDVDYFATFWDGIAYLIPVSECLTQKNLHLKNTGRKDWSYIGDYEAQCIIASYYAEMVEVLPTLFPDE